MDFSLSVHFNVLKSSIKSILRQMNSNSQSQHKHKASMRRKSSLHCIVCNTFYLRFPALFVAESFPGLEKAASLLGNSE